MEAERKARGAYYTPARVARALAGWAVRRPTDRVLDPACGDGAFLREVRANALGIEINARAAAQASHFGQVLRGDFFSLVERLPKFDAVVGNPPFIRYQSIAPETKSRLQTLCAGRGFAFGGESSAWAAFVGLAATLLSPGGRLAMVVPRESLFTNYTKSLLDFLRSKFAGVRIEPLDELLFDGALEKIALLYCDDFGPPAEASAKAGKKTDAAPEPWRWREIPRECRATVRSALAEMRPLSDVADLRLGLVTGDKEFFIVGEDFPRENRTPVLATPTPIAGAIFTRADWPGTHLFAAPPLTPAALRHIKEGESGGVHRRFKCRIRDPWYALKLGPVPDLLVGYLIGNRPRLAVNAAGVRVTNNLHGLFVKGADPRALAASFYNAATLISIELLGRVYGGGVMKIEPGDAPRILIPRKLEGNLDAVDRALRAGSLPSSPRLLDRAYRALRRSRVKS